MKEPTAIPSEQWSGKRANALAWQRRLLGAVATLCIAVQFKGWLFLSSAALVVWLLALSLLDRGSLRRLWMPRFWLITGVFALGSGLLLGVRDEQLWGMPLSKSGIEAGALMVVRGVFIFALATWASRSLSERSLVRAAQWLRVPALGTAIPTALKLLPQLEVSLRRALSPGEGRGRPGRVRKVAIELVCETARLAEEMAAREQTDQASAPGPILAAVVADPGVGKTTAMEQILTLLRASGLKVGGVLQPAVFQGGERVGYQLRDVATGEERPFARRRQARGEDGLGFDFEDSGWKWAGQRINRARQQGDVVVVDELGKLEARGEGHLPALLEPLHNERARLWLLSVRAQSRPAIEGCLQPFKLVYSPGSGGDGLEKFVRQLRTKLTKEGDKLNEL